MPEAVKGLVVGLTGGIGSGKSAAAEGFAALGAAVVDSDAIAHEITAPGSLAMPLLAAAFGRDIVAADGSLDRAAMRRRAFADPDTRKRLEGILHPLIRIRSDDLCREALAAGAPYVILMVPLLIESGIYQGKVDRIAVVDCDDETRIARVMARSRLSREEVLAIVASQASRQQRLAAADDVIDNSGGRAALTAQVRELHRRYLEQSGIIRTTG